MPGGRKYTTEQINWVLNQILLGHDKESIIERYRIKFNNKDWDNAQFKYVKQTYGDHPDFGCKLVNRGVATAVRAPAPVSASQLGQMRAQSPASAVPAPSAIHQPVVDVLSNS
ncbi:hypothetical protein TruAng_003031 [Truncatella angustata]|nr:hypothetical protein TruAng_003031 [Truncatella angustata]